MGKKIAVIIDDMFEDSEYQKPADAFRDAGHELVHLGVKAGAEVKGKKEGTTVKIDQAVTEAQPDRFDALLIPGGYSPDRLRVSPDAVAFARKFMDDGKPVFSICHGAQLLVTAKALEGRKATGWKSIRQDLIYAGAEYCDQEVVVDGNLVTSRQPSDLPAFIEAARKKLQ
ncbi:MAG: DJ-1/PfpI/YhbO family deglycase/protease [Candidatus Omnitrophica bacterium]|nr:DJ-1/PfpI/YhbO family deglycase/protease [Candidatus Omnitrophota bacterium]